MIITKKGLLYNFKDDYLKSRKLKNIRNYPIAQLESSNGSSSEVEGESSGCSGHEAAHNKQENSFDEDGILKY